MSPRGRNRLINPGGFVDQILGGTLAGSLEVATRAWSTFHFTKNALPTELAGRGVDDVAALPHYPYRDDALLLWDAISTSSVRRQSMPRHGLRHDCSLGEIDGG
jgi:arachidonate 15-lipoxygenase